MMGQRGRLTPVDVAYIGVGVFVFGIFIGPIYSFLGQNAALLGTGDTYLIQMIIPGALVGVMVLIMATAVQGQ